MILRRIVLNKFATTVLFVSTTLLPPTLFFSTETSAQCSEQGCHDVDLKIMSWNIYMLPRFWIHTGQLQRAKEIADALKNENVDIIVFEEAFDKESRRIIWKGIKASFPYQSGDPQKNKFWKSNSGVWIISKVPLTLMKQIFFKQSRGSDRMACKGAMLLRAEKDNVCFQLVGTHLQAELAHQNVQPIRKTQYEQIRKELLEPYAEKDVPQFIAGDFNTMRSDTGSYSQMISSMNVTPCDMVGNRCFSFDYKDNDLIKGTAEKPQLIDYIFFKNKPSSEVKGNMWIKVFKKKWNNKHIDLSDHFAITGVISL